MFLYNYRGQAESAKGVLMRKSWTRSSEVLPMDRGYVLAVTPAGIEAAVILDFAGSNPHWVALTGKYKLDEVKLWMDFPPIPDELREE
jgi:hypothetical protein